MRAFDYSDDRKVGPVGVDIIGVVVEILPSHLPLCHLLSLRHGRRLPRGHGGFPQVITVVGIREQDHGIDFRVIIKVAQLSTERTPFQPTKTVCITRVGIVARFRISASGKYGQ